MSAVAACSAIPVPASVPDAAASAADSTGTQEGASATSADGGRGSFQRLMNQASDGQSQGQSGSNSTSSDADAAARTGADASSTRTQSTQQCGEPSAQQAGQTGSQDVAATATAATAALDTASALGAEQLTAADDLLATLALAGLVPAAASGSAPAATTSADGARSGATATKQEQDDGSPTDDALASALAALAQLGIAPQPVATAPVPTSASSTGDGAAAVQAAATDLGATLAAATAKPVASATDASLARLRTAISTSSESASAAVADAAANANAGVAVRVDATGGLISLRDLLDGRGADAAQGKDPIETIAAQMKLGDSTAASTTTTVDGTRAADVVTRTISIPVQHPRWADAVSSEVRLFADQGVQNATLRLSPEHLGPVEVRLSLNDGQVNVNFAAANAETRAALEQSLPRLREMLAGAGLSLGEAQVQQQMRQGSQNQFNGEGATADTDVRDSLVRVPTRLGLVDEYA